MARALYNNSADFAALHQQVLGVTEDHVALTGTVANLATEMRGGFSAINAKLDKRSEIPWLGLSFLLSALLAVGWLAYAPIKDEQTYLRADFNTLQAAQTKTAADVAYLNGQLHPLPH